MRSAVRLVLLGLVFAPLLAALVAPVSAGTQAAPEITDPAEDQSLTPAGEDLEESTCLMTGTAACLFQRIDILNVWLANETDTTVNVFMEFSDLPQGPTTATNAWTFTATPVGGTDPVTVTIDGVGGGQAATEPTAGANALAVVRDGTILIITVDKAIYGGATGLTALSAMGQSRAPLSSPGNVLLASDTAAADPALVYTFSGGATVDPNDTDGDGLNDTWEQTYFSSLNQNATGDPDGDGLTNGQEQALGTDPTKADTDGDGATDGEEFAAGTDPLDPNSKPASSTTTTPSDTNSTTTTPSNSTSSSTTDSGGDTDFLSKLQDASTGYLMYSGIGMAVVVVLALIGRFGRWGL